MLRTAGYTAPIRESWRFTNQSNAFCNLMVTANVCMCGSGRLVRQHGRGHDRQFRRQRHRARHVRPRRRDHHRRSAARPRARGARAAGASRTTSTSSAIAASPPWRAAPRTAPTRSCTTSSAGPLQAALGGRGEGDRRNLLRLPRPDPPLRRKPFRRRRSKMPTIAADPYRLALERRPAAGQHRADRHRHADRFLRQGRLCRRDGLRPLADARADRADLRACSPPCGPAATPSSTRARGIAPILPTCPQTSAGARSRSARASATPALAETSSFAANRAGTSSRSSRRCPARSSSTSPARARSARPTST